MLGAMMASLSTANRDLILDLASFPRDFRARCAVFLEELNPM
jgi:hypothetical protein